MELPAQKIITTSTAKFRRLSRRRKIFFLIVLFICLIITIIFFQNILKPPPYTLAKAQKADLTAVVSESGTIAANNTIDIYSPTTGVIEEMYIQNGDYVQEGQELFTVKSTATDQEKQAAYANYLTAKAGLDAAESNANVLRSAMYDKWDTFRGLATNSQYESNGVPKETERLSAEFQMAQDDWKAAEAKYKDQQTVIAQARAQVNSTWLLYQTTQNAVVKAPVSGTIANLASLARTSVAAKTPTITPQPVLTIADFGHAEVVVALNETDSSKVTPGQRATVELKALDKKYDGIVSRVDDIGTNTNGVVTYKAYVEILQADSQIKTGMTVDVDIITKQLEDVLTVPNAAVKPYKGGRAVRIVNPKTKKVEYLPVVIGIKGETRTQILKGLTEGQEVVTSLSNEQFKRPSLF